MPIEKSAGAVIFRKENNKIYYLLLHYQGGHWDFPKGITEKKRKDRRDSKKGVKEEAGIEDIVFLNGLLK